MHTIELSTIQDFTANYTGPLFDAVLCDAPYELDFMGKHWDRSGVAFDPAVWRGVYDLLKPGAFLFAFGGTRTYHRMTCAIEDAGFEIRDCLMWVYGSGFPKSHDISKAIDREAGAEREVVGGTRPNGFVSPNGKNTCRWGISNTHTESAQSITAPQPPPLKHGTATAQPCKPAWESVIVAKSNLTPVPHSW
jgi:site-specific DNA-methyltransferase (adenine-specific)